MVRVRSGPGDQPAADGTARDRLRASRADRDRVIDLLKTAFVREQLTHGELGERTGRALTARTYAELDALTADLPAGPYPVRFAAPVAGHSPARPGELAPDRPVPRSARLWIALVALLVLLSAVVASVVLTPAAGLLILSLATVVMFLSVWSSYALGRK